MILFLMVTQQNTYRDILKNIAITVAKYSHKNQTIIAKLVCSCFDTDDCRNLYEIPLLINKGKNVWSTIKVTIEFLPISNHEEAGKR